MTGEWQAYVVLERIEPGVTPPYCVHGRATCMGECDEWVWLGSETARVVVSGEALPLCLQCASARAAVLGRPSGHLEDRRRADGPH